MNVPANCVPSSVSGEGVGHWNCLHFRRSAARLAIAGTTVTKLVEVGLPAFPEQLLDCVFYLYRNIEDAERGTEYGGTGFFVGVKSATNPGWSYIYAVTNWHVAVRDGFSMIRLNMRDGNRMVFPLDVSDWRFEPQGGDVAIAAFAPNFKLHKSEYLMIFDPSSPTAGVAIRKEQDADGTWVLGEDVVMMGRFINHDGAQNANLPALRFGHISIRPSAIHWCNSGPGVHYYCLDMHSRSGFSGSPVIAYRTPGSDLRAMLDMSNDSLNWRLQVCLLGIHCGQFNEEMKSLLNGKELYSSGLSGMTVALPAWKIVEMLNKPVFAGQRAEQDERWKGKAPCAE